jgi:hypothetical protein
MASRSLRSPSKPALLAGQASVIDFSNYDGTYSGTGPGGRRWRITTAFTGWRLEFRDPGDLTGTYAGTHATLAAAKTEAAR